MKKGGVTFEFGHVGINAQTPEDGARMKKFFAEVMGYENYREIPASFFSGITKIDGGI